MIESLNIHYAYAVTDKGNDFSFVGFQCVNGEMTKYLPALFGNKEDVVEFINIEGFDIKRFALINLDDKNLESQLEQLGNEVGKFRAQKYSLLLEDLTNLSLELDKECDKSYNERTQTVLKGTSNRIKFLLQNFI